MHMPCNLAFVSFVYHVFDSRAIGVIISSNKSALKGHPHQYYLQEVSQVSAK